MLVDHVTAVNDALSTRASSGQSLERPTTSSRMAAHLDFVPASIYLIGRVGATGPRFCQLEARLRWWDLEKRHRVTPSERDRQARLRTRDLENLGQG